MPPLRHLFRMNPGDRLKMGIIEKKVAVLSIFLVVLRVIYATDRYLTDFRQISDRFMNILGPTLVLSTQFGAYCLLTLH